MHLTQGSVRCWCSGRMSHSLLPGDKEVVMKLSDPEGVCAHTSEFVFTFTSMPSSHPAVRAFPSPGSSEPRTAPLLCAVPNAWSSKSDALPSPGALRGWCPAVLRGADFVRVAAPPEMYR